MMNFHYKYPFIFILILFLNISHGQNMVEYKVSKQLLSKINEQNPIEFIIYLEKQYKVKPIGENETKIDKSIKSFKNLKENNLKAQTEIVQLLDRWGYTYRRYYIVNAIWIKGDKKILELLARNPKIKYITYDSPVKQDILDLDEQKGLENEITTWGIKMIKADSVWDLGFKGENVVVGGQDTGYDWQHPALKQKYRGYVNDTLANHDYNWHDAIHEISSLNNDSIVDPSNNPCGLDSQIPCDDHSHGTHTMGTMAGSADSLIIGVAPEAKWVGCRNMERGWGKPSTYIECFEWFMAPTDIKGQNPDPAKSPDVINNSWGCPVVEGCDSTNWQYMELALDNLRNSGVFVVVSAGNDGIRNCGSIRNPAAMFKNSFAVGATRQIIDTTGLTFRDTIAGFSSRGPVTVDGSNRLKPDITAPGQGVLSSVPGNKYRYSSGTSMAGPHVVGVVALMLSANPDLRGKVEKIAQIIEETADPRYDIDSCRGIDEPVLPNSVYGYGRINALAAVEKALEIKTSLKKEPLNNNEIVVFPNPFDNHISFQYGKEERPVSVEIFDGLGNKLINYAPESNDIDTQSLNPGVYFIMIRFENKYYIKKLIKI